MNFIGLTMILFAALIKDNTFLTAILIIPGASICTTKYLIDRKRTCRSGNFHKFYI